MEVISLQRENHTILHVLQQQHRVMWYTHNTNDELEQYNAPNRREHTHGTGRTSDKHREETIQTSSAISITKNNSPKNRRNSSISCKQWRSGCWTTPPLSCRPGRETYNAFNTLIDRTFRGHYQELGWQTKQQFAKFALVCTCKQKIQTILQEFFNKH